MIEKSLFGEALTARSGIEDLMDDLGHAMAGAHGPMRMLGGGNPALIPEVQAIWRERMGELLDEGDSFDRMLTVYDPPKGNVRFAKAVAGYLRRKYGWDLGPENVAVTAGGQAAFFYLFNLLAGPTGGGASRKVLLPIAPEYIGYANQGLGSDFFTSVTPEIEFHGAHEFKYRVDFEQLRVDPDVAAMCVSRPTNPSGNVLTDGEIDHLDRLAREAGVPLIIDNAYGAPFPGIVFREIQPVWNENVILVLSLSKLGLPGTRTGIVIARPEIVHAIGSMTAVVGLANGNVGQAIATPLIESGRIDEMVTDLIRPFYERKARLARACVAEFFDDSLDYHVHASEGAMFLWLWFRGLPISAAELYERLKQRGVLVVPGHYFAFGGSEEARQHAGECVRVSFAMCDDVVREGIGVLAEEVKRAYAAGL
ncbi:MAG: valine--pyruvate transaminase [Chthoniobacterales bacterium]